MKLYHLPLCVLLSFSTASFAFAKSKDSKAYPEHGSIYADYLAGSYANFIDDSQARSLYFSRAFYAAPDDMKFGRLALLSTFNAGDVRQSVKIASRVYRQHKNESMARAILALDAFSKGKTSRAQKYLKDKTPDLTANILMTLMRGWNDVARGDLEAARESFSNIGGAAYFDIFGELQIAKLELRAGNYEAADEALKTVEEAGVSPVEAVLTRARLEVARGNNEAATKVLKTYIDNNSAAQIGPIGVMYEDLKSGKTVQTKLTIRQQAARALVDPAFGFFVANRSVDGGEIYLRFARQIDPSYHKGTLWLGALLEDTERPDEAYELYSSIETSSSYYPSAKLNQANVHFVKEEDAAALDLLEALNESHPSFVSRESVGRARFFRENYEEALPFYDALLSGMSEDDLSKNIEPLRFRGIIYERIGQWDKAEIDFKRVLSIVPDDVDTLNYLGYTWVDRGENLKEAFDMIRKAVEEQPDSGAIVDSLGWAHYKLGEYQEAKINLEKAATLSPSSATIIDHLGDVYWKLNRKREAGYQWKRALELDPTDKELTAIKQKLKGGLEAVTAAP